MLAQACLGETSSCWFWSNSATSSSWVEREWNLAYQLKRRIVPYVIDKSPPESVNLIWPRSMLLFAPPVRFTGSVLSAQIRVRTVAVRSRAGCQVELQTPIGGNLVQNPVMESRAVEDCGLSISSRWNVVGLRATRRVLICAQVDARPKGVPRSLLVNASHGNRSPEVGIAPGTDQIDLGSHARSPVPNATDRHRFRSLSPSGS